MAANYIIVDLIKFRVIRKWFKVLIFDSFGDACVYGKKHLDNFKLIKL